MSIVEIIFYVLAALTIISAGYVVLSGNLVRSIFMFFVTLFCIAGLYVFALADFVAVAQIVIYVGGVLVLMLFAFMLSAKETLNTLIKNKTPLFSVSKWLGAGIALLFLMVLLTVFLKIDFESLNWLKLAKEQNQIRLATDETISNIGINLMTGYLLPFEVIAIFLMMALIGAAHIARREQQTL